MREMVFGEEHEVCYEVHQDLFDNKWRVIKHLGSEPKHWSLLDTVAWCLTEESALAAKRLFETK